MSDADDLATRGPSQRCDLHRTQLVVSATHPLRTPVAAMLGLVGLIENTPLEKRQRTLISSLKSSCENLMVLVDGLIDLSLLENGQLQLHCHDLNIKEIIKETVGLLAPLAKEKNLRLEHSMDADIPSALQGDSRRLRQIVFNLLANAIQFTPAGCVSLKVISLTSLQADGMRLRFEIQDTGIGLSPEESQQVLGEPKGGSLQENGLGLRIVTSLVQRMGGKLGVESRLGQGSLFWFEIDFEGGCQLQCASSHKSCYRLLVAEDNPIVARVLKMQLEELGHEVTTVGDGLQAYHLAKTNCFAAIIMDCQMPRMDGFEATRRLRQIFSAVELPIIALTANAQIGESGSFRAAGMNDLLIKPVPALEVQRLLEYWLDHSAA